ncbi:hypothetical protein EDB85DRAFT_1894715 [Lactarius pseudohatsudake]|nr:hypothetical protein EDB85DRAFT_1894715 [Lactarius pseudohatsudake]
MTHSVIVSFESVSPSYSIVLAAIAAASLSSPPYRRRCNGLAIGPLLSFVACVKAGLAHRVELTLRRDLVQRRHCIVALWGPAHCVVMVSWRGIVMVLQRDVMTIKTRYGFQHSSDGNLGIRSSTCGLVDNILGLVSVSHGVVPTATAPYGFVSPVHATRSAHHHDKTSVHQHADRVTLQRCWEHTFRLLHLRHRAPRSLSLVSLNDSTRSRINLNLIPTSPAHFPGIQAPRPEPATTHLARKSGRGEGDTNIDGSSSDKDDFDGGLDTRVWNRTAALPHALPPPPPPPPPPPHPTSRTPALAVSLTYLPAITLLASPLLVSVGMQHGPVASCDAAQRSQPPCVTPITATVLFVFGLFFADDNDNCNRDHDR